MKKIKIKRIYEEPSENDGYRILVDRLWPRGVSKEDAALDDWNKDVAPTEKLRKWFDHDTDKFTEFEKKYRKELEGKTTDLDEIKNKAQNQRVTLLYGAKDTEHNQAVVLQKLLNK
ncbi:DUF488 domain-containing protein [Marinirhabdus gelatinilytica]|uniref:Uncharacterized protein YeaO (DUF488 family) n=1 Tax=Marinirhabdus gelatinilytica TaxID=1703343 RepID=A0A370QLD3_9FLAO|nr:DUF488 domain-containing protein [Marinirhabdus gelatinilytica]RDK89187.1 uncharacterized protein YeaO (DUF488 family) [Marinirhabdus gelatinilytica]